MKIKISICLLLFAIMLTSCQLPSTVDSTGYYDAYEIVRTAVPFANDGDIEKSLSRVYLLETDDYGRRLYRYDLYSYTLSGPISIWLVRQYATSDYAYYYSDVCYLIFSRDDSPNEQELVKLKLANDWNKNLNRDICSSVRYKHPANHIDDYDDETVLSVLLNHFNLSADKSVGFDSLEFCGDKQIFLVSEYLVTKSEYLEGNDVYTRYAAHLVMIDIKNVKVLASSELPLSVFDLDGDINTIGTYIKQFKQEKGFYQ